MLSAMEEYIRDPQVQCSREMPGLLCRREAPLAVRRLSNHLVYLNVWKHCCWVFNRSMTSWEHVTALLEK